MCPASMTTSSAWLARSWGAADDLVAGGDPGDVRPHLLDHAGEVAALAGRERGRPPIVHQALADGGLAG